MAVNKPTGDNARKGSVKKRTQLKNPLTKTFTKRDKVSGQFISVKRSAEKFKGVRQGEVMGKFFLAFRRCRPHWIGGMCHFSLRPSAEFNRVARIGI